MKVGAGRRKSCQRSVRMALKEIDLQGLNSILHHVVIWRRHHPYVDRKEHPFFSYNEKYLLSIDDILEIFEIGPI